MAENTNKRANAGAKRALRRSQIPTKRSINLAVVGEKHVRYGLAVPGVLLIIVAAALFSKFLVFDRLAEVAAAQHEVVVLQNRLDAGYEELAGFDDLNELYAHYTYSGMTAEELRRTDRVEVLSLIERVIMPRAGVQSWSLTSNELTINMTGQTLQQINLIVQALEADDLVDFCTVTTAVSNDSVIIIDDDIVTARVVVYLNPELEANRG